MNDTSPKAADDYERIIMACSPEERLRMGCSMFDTAKELVKMAVLDQNRNADSKEIKRKIFLRFYGQEFDEAQKRKILECL